VYPTLDLVGALAHAGQGQVHVVHLAVKLAHWHVLAALLAQLGHCQPVLAVLPNC
jgi:hypothetical protein